MRIAFVKTLHDIAKRDKNVMLLTGDLGYSVFEKFIEELPDQFLNMGVAEQNMAGVAAGLAMEGKVPVIYSIIPFTTMRNYEQIRNDVCYQDLNVKIVGVGAGFSYGPYGHTHHALEDLGILRTIPNLTIYSPGDPIETTAVTRLAFEQTGPAYIRLGRAGEPLVHKKNAKLLSDGTSIIREGSDLTIFATGTMLFGANEVVDILAGKGISARLISVARVKPIDEKKIIKLSSERRAVFTIEEHSVIGGLGSAVAEVLSEGGYSGHFKRIGVPDRFTKAIGSQQYMRMNNSLTPSQIAHTIIKTIKK